MSKLTLIIILLAVLVAGGTGVYYQDWRLTATAAFLSLTGVGCNIYCTRRRQS